MQRKIDAVLGAISTVAAVISGMVIFVMMVMVTLDAIGRKFLVTVPGALEFSEAMMVAVVFLALIAVQRYRENVFVGIATRNLPPRGKALLDAIHATVAIVMFGIFAWIGFERAIDSWEIREFRIATIMVPIWPFRWFIPFGLVLLCLQLAATAFEDFRSSTPHDEGSLPSV